MLILSQSYRKVLLTCLSKNFERLTNNLVHKIIYLMQSIETFPCFYEFFYFKKEGPFCADIDIDLIETERMGGIRYYDKQNIRVSEPGICDDHLTISPGSKYSKIYKTNKEFFQKIYPFIEAVKDLANTEHEYNLLASITYIDNHINEFVEEKVDKVDFTEMIMQEYTTCNLKSIIHFRKILKSHNFIKDESTSLTLVNNKNM